MFAPSTLKPAVLERTPNFPGDLTIEHARWARPNLSMIQSACWTRNNSKRRAYFLALLLRLSR